MGKKSKSKSTTCKPSVSKGKVLNLFCEASRSFDTFGPDWEIDGAHDGEDANGKRDGRRDSSSGKIDSKIPRRFRRGHSRRFSESKRDAKHPDESLPRKVSLSLNPWRPDPGRSISASSICGDWLLHAGGGAAGCINLAHARAVEGGGGLMWTVGRAVS